MTMDEIQNSYNAYMEETVDAYLSIGSHNDIYKHFRGVVFGLGFALGYRHGRITSDINNAIADTKLRMLSEAI